MKLQRHGNGGLEMAYFVRLAGKIPPFFSSPIDDSASLHRHFIDSVEDQPLSPAVALLP